MAKAKMHLAAGEECSVVVLGHVYRCVLVQADMEITRHPISVDSLLDDSFGTAVPGLQRGHLTCQYHVLGVADVTPDQSAKLQAVIDEVAPINVTKRQITLED